MYSGWFIVVTCLNFSRIFRFLGLSSLIMSNSWPDLLYKLTRNGKVEKAAIVDQHGHVIVSSRGFNVTKEDLNSVRSAFYGCHSTLMKVKVHGQLYTCFRHSTPTDTVVGQAGDDILVIHRTEGLSVVGLGHAGTPGSCLFEITKFATEIQEKRKNSRFK